LVRAKRLCLSSKRESTAKKYGRYYKMFDDWVRTYAQGRALPAEGLTVGLYLTQVTETASSKSVVESHFYAIRWAHKMCGLEDPTEHPFPKMIIEAARRRLGTAKDPKKPADKDLLNRLCEEYGGPNASLRDLRLVCMSLLAFAGFLRFNEVQQLKWGDVKFYETYLTIFIKSSKTDTYNEGATIPIAAGESICPMRFFKRFSALTAEPQEHFKDYYIFRPIVSKQGSFVLNQKNSPISYQRARQDLHLYLKKSNISAKSFGWHSFRHGGATAAANAGIPDRLFKLHGRWTSDHAKNIYVHEDLSSRLEVTKSLAL